MKRCWIGLAVAIVSGLCALPARSATPGIDQYKFFGFAPGGYRITTDHTDASRPWLEIAADHPRTNEFGSVEWAYDALALRAKRIRVTAELQTTGDVQDGTLWVKVDSPLTIVFDGPTESTIDSVAPLRQLHGEHRWTQVYVVADVPADATAIHAGIILQGAHGAVRTTLPQVTEVGTDVAVTAMSVPASDAGPQSTIAPIDSVRRTALVNDARRISKPIVSSDPTARGNDLNPILNAISDARIVGLGEATHGTSEFSNLKDRIFRTLVERRHFTVFAIEAPQPEVREMERFVAGENVTPRQAMKSLQFGVWETSEVLALAQWMRSYNAKRGTRPALHFAGFDMQSAEVAAASVSTAVRRANAPAGSRVADGVACVEKQASVRAKMTNAGWHSCQASVAAVAPTVLRYVGDPDTRHDFNILQQFSGFNDPGAAHSYRQNALRDRDMADNVSWLANVKYPNQRMVVWAHNEHIEKRNTQPFPSMGSSLATRFGRDYYRLGFAFFDGSIRAWDGLRHFKSVEVDTPPPNTFDEVMHGADRGIFFLKLDDMPTSELSEWLAKPVWHRDIGFQYIPHQDMSFLVCDSLRTDYNGLISLITAMHHMAFQRKCSAA